MCECEKVFVGRFSKMSCFHQFLIDNFKFRCHRNEARTQRNGLKWSIVNNTNEHIILKVHHEPAISWKYDIFKYILHRLEYFTVTGVFSSVARLVQSQVQQTTSREAEEGAAVAIINVQSRLKGPASVKLMQIAAVSSLSSRGVTDDAKQWTFHLAPRRQLLYDRDGARRGQMNYRAAIYHAGPIGKNTNEQLANLALINCFRQQTSL